MAVTLTRADAKRLGEQAGGFGIGPGLLSRALVRYGLDHIDDPGVQAVIAEVKAADRERRRRVGVKAMKSRWPDTKEKKESSE
ncbi:hypothetical protein A5766_04430 [Gordonia sp. 852002-51296_SCH5728562-b]|nr:hypothetical protein A5766_04430 [Gordonia sp. 852002-51296_SCH5728562-b]